MLFPYQALQASYEFEKSLRKEKVIEKEESRLGRSWNKPLGYPLKNVKGHGPEEYTLLIEWQKKI
jgi:hypothetical protein